MRIAEAITGTWGFCLDERGVGRKEAWQEKGIPDPEEIVVPHTYNVNARGAEYHGDAWYQYCFTAPREWEGRRIGLDFHGIYRDAVLWMNGVQIAVHNGAGYTSFEADTLDTVKCGETNRLCIQVTNKHSANALPWMENFDWADDGGIIRPVQWIITNKTAIQGMRIDAVPEIKTIGSRADKAAAVISYRTSLYENGASDADCALEYTLYEGPKEKKAAPVLSGRGALEGEIRIPEVALWHFDAPVLYTFEAKLLVAGEEADVWSTSIGFRSLAPYGHEFLFNGEPVQLTGTEWMPGSDPRIGIAERKEDLERWLSLLKESNCVFTRVHWQQDSALYDWCDRNGMLIQEEIPFWGFPKEPVTHEKLIAQAQADEMLRSHYNHPSIIAWGVGNELDGQSEITKAYVRDMIAYFKKQDAHRLISYVSNTAWYDLADASTAGDMIMTNEYIGTWQQGLDNEESVRTFAQANSTKPLVIAEYGICEPVFQGGDARRIDIFLTKMDIYRRNQVGGTINFCLNDYRTHIGEDGQGPLKKRVHGSTDIYGNPKPSYWVVKEECSPIQILEVKKEGRRICVTMRNRDALPKYQIKGYSCEIQNAFGQKMAFARIPDMLPGEKADVILETDCAGGDAALVVWRPTGSVCCRKDLA